MACLGFAEVGTTRSVVVDMSNDMRDLMFSTNRLYLRVQRLRDELNDVIIDVSNMLDAVSKLSNHLYLQELIDDTEKVE